MTSSPSSARKRDRGDGSIRPRPDGRWEARYYVPNGTGRRRISVFGKTRIEVRARLKEALAKSEAGVRPSPARETAATFLATWIDAVEPSLRPRTADLYRQIVRDHLAPAFVRVPLSKLTPQCVQLLYADMLASGRSPKTVQNVALVLHRALRDAVRWSLITRNVCDLVDAPRVPRREMHALDVEQARQVLAALEGEPLQALFVVAITTGLRQGELLALRWMHVDLDRAVLSVVGSLEQRHGHESRVVEPKTSRSRRQVQLTAGAVDALRLHRQQSASIGFVFAREHGAPLNAQIVNRAWDRVAAHAGVPRVRFHDLRHTAASLMLSRGVHPKIASEMLGHSTVAITLDLYSHVTPTMQREAAAVMDELLSRVRRPGGGDVLSPGFDPQSDPHAAQKTAGN